MIHIHHSSFIIQHSSYYINLHAYTYISVSALSPRAEQELKRELTGVLLNDEQEVKKRFGGDIGFSVLIDWPSKVRW